MDEKMLALLAGLAGLEKALAEFPADVAAAAAQSTGHRSAIQVPAEPAAEPWPPMRTGVPR